MCIFKKGRESQKNSRSTKKGEAWIGVSRVLGGGKQNGGSSIRETEGRKQKGGSRRTEVKGRKQRGGSRRAEVKAREQKDGSKRAGAEGLKQNSEKSERGR